jgi:uncharacterized protein
VRSKKLDTSYALRLERGERIVEALTAFCARAKIAAASFSGLGTCRNAEIGFFHIEAGAYAFRTFPEDCEITALTGNVNLVDGKPHVHAHIVLGDSLFRSWSGHLKEAEVLATCEIVLTRLKGTLVRKRDKKSGLNLLEI